jgi:hypothetical protein
MDLFSYIKQYLKSVFQFLKTSKGMFLKELKHLKNFKKHFKNLRYDYSMFILLIAL